MLWSTLFDKLENQPMRVTRHRRVHAVIDGRRVYLDLKFDEKGEPYLVPLTETKTPEPDAPYAKIYRYHVCLETPEVMGSGSSTTREYCCQTETDAMAALRDGRNRLTRLVETTAGEKVTQYWNDQDGRWEDMDGDPLPY